MTIPKPFGAFLRGTILLIAALGLAAPEARSALQPGFPAPAFTQVEPKAWLNSRPLTWADLRGKVVVLDFWTFACWNCYRSIPWLNTLRAKYGQDLVIVGVHTPELAHEYDLDRLKAKLGEYAVTDPQMIDNDHAYWNAMRNRAWPAFYLVDRRGQVRARHIGETHENDRSAKAIEADIRELLAEPADRRTP
jgi:thiol-disulfide isomerase/thioredoxin